MTTARDALAARLRLARDHAGLSQGQVARLLGVHRPTISEIEAGRRRVTAEELATLAQTYEVSLEWLAGEHAEKVRGLDDRVLLAARELAKLKDADLDKVIKLLSSLRPAREKPRK